MDNKDSDITPVGFIFMIIAFSPFLYLKYGEAFVDGFLFFLPIFFIVIVATLYLHYHKKSTENGSSFLAEIEKDLPDMSPIHIFFFLLVTTPIWCFIIACKQEYLYGMVVLFIVYSIYFYGFRRMK